MGLSPCDTRRRPSVILDAGYVSVDIYQTANIIGLRGKKLICVISIIFSLFLISFINLICLFWFMSKLDWPLLDRNGSKIFRIDHREHQVEFYKQVIANESIYTSEINHIEKIDLLTDKQIDVYGNQNLILFDDDQILFNTDKFVLNQSSIDFTNLHSFKFNKRLKTRVHLNQINSQHIHHKCLNISANNQLSISNINHAYFYSQCLILQANRNNRRSILRFNNFLKKSKTVHNSHQKISSGNLRLKSDLIYFDLPRFPLLGQNYRTESSIYRICICNTTFLFLRTFAHQSCPFC